MMIVKKQKTYRGAELFPKLLTICLRSWMRLRGFVVYEFIAAQQSDLDFIVAEICEGAKQGHFDSEFLTQSGVYALRSNLEEVIEKKVLVPMFDPEWGPDESLHASLLVYRCLATGEAIGFVLVSGSAKLDCDFDLAMVGVREGFRRKGHGKRMIALLVSRLYKGRRIYARCNPVSNIMCQILEKADFTFLKTNRFGKREFEFNKS